MRLWPVLLTLVLGTAAVAQQVTGQETGKRLDFTELFRPGLKTVEFEVSYTLQHQLPTSADSDFHGLGLDLRSLRFRSARSAVGLQAGWNSLGCETRTTDLWSLAALYRHYFAVEPRRAWYWQAAGGAGYLSQLTREQSSNWNFYWEAAAGVQWAAGSRGAWLAQYRFVHVSNASTSHRNLGINASEIGFGRSVFF